jgi:hypothetical protein
MNRTQKIQFLERFPEVITLISKLNELPEADRFYYRDNALMMILTNTSRNDAEALGTLNRLIYLNNKILDKIPKRILK